LRKTLVAINSPLDLLLQNDSRQTARPKRFDVVGIGVSTVDLIMVVDELPGAELVQRAHAALLQGGGPVATAMVAVARLGGRSAMIDKLGNDWRGKLILEEFAREGVATDYIARAKGGSSSVASVLVRKGDAARTIAYSPGDAGELSAAELPEEAIASSRILHLNGRHLQASLAAARSAKLQGVPVSFDGGAHRYGDQLRELIGLTDLCIVARQFAAAFSGEEDLAASASGLLNCGPQIVVITAGAEGSWVFDREGRRFHHPAFRLERVVDTTGAGDAYHGAFLFGISNGYSLEKCARFASAVAAMNTMQLGGRSALPSCSEAWCFVNERHRTQEDFPAVF
jgi:sulfofructose kinase